jgi:hypothetical protein
VVVAWVRGAVRGDDGRVVHVRRHAWIRDAALDGEGAGGFFGCCVGTKSGAKGWGTLGGGAIAGLLVVCTLGGMAWGGGIIVRLRICAIWMEALVVGEPYVSDGMFGCNRVSMSSAVHR